MATSVCPYYITNAPPCTTYIVKMSCKAKIKANADKYQGQLFRLGKNGAKLRYIPIQSSDNPNEVGSQYAANGYSMPIAAQPIATQQSSDSSFYPQQAPRDQEARDLSSQLNQPSQFNADFLQQLKHEFGSNSSHTYDPALDAAYQQQVASNAATATKSSMATSVANSRATMNAPSKQQPHASGYVPASHGKTGSNEDEDVPFYNQAPNPSTRTDKYIPINRSKLKLD